MTRVDIALSFDISYEMLDILCGEYIGEGNSRIVFDCTILPEYVVKIQKENSNHDNINEWEMYWSVAYQDKKKWLAECKWLSNNGRILIQKKARPITDKNKKNIPELIPAFLTDMKFSNYGFIGKQFVCFDYAFSAGICMSDSLGKKMRKFKSHLNEK